MQARQSLLCAALAKGRQARKEAGGTHASMATSDEGSGPGTMATGAPAVSLSSMPEDILMKILPQLDPQR